MESWVTFQSQQNISTQQNSIAELFRRSKVDGDFKLIFSQIHGPTSDRAQLQ